MGSSGAEISESCSMDRALGIAGGGGIFVAFLQQSSQVSRG